MASFLNVAEGLQIFEKYRPGKQLAGAEHDVILSIDMPMEDLSADDLRRLDDMGWFLSGEFACWAIFV